MYIIIIIILFATFSNILIPNIIMKNNDRLKEIDEYVDKIKPNDYELNKNQNMRSF